MAYNKIQLLQHPCPFYSLDLAPKDYFLFQKVKEELAGVSLTPEYLKKIWKKEVGVDEFVVAFRRYLDGCNKANKSTRYVKKSSA